MRNEAARTEAILKWIFLINALINWAVSVRGIIDPLSVAQFFGGPEPNYSFVIRLWNSFIFMFGWMFWEVSRNVRGKAALIKYNWIEKTITASAVTLGFFTGEAPLKLMLLIILTNFLWIPFIAYFDFKLGGIMRRERADANQT